MSKKLESELSDQIIRALTSRGHKLWKQGVSDLVGIAADGRAILFLVKLPGDEKISGLEYLFIFGCAVASPLAIVSVVSSADDAITFVESQRYASKASVDCVRMVHTSQLSQDEMGRYIAAKKALRSVCGFDDPA